MATEKEMLDIYKNHLASTGKDRKRYIDFVQKFLAYADGKYDRETVDGFIKNEKRKHHYSDGTVNLEFRVIRTFFGRNKLDWPFNKGEAPVIHEGDVNQPAIDPEEGRILIQKMRAADSGHPVIAAAQTFLAISSVYGLRRTEMVNLRSKHINIPDRTLFIETLKHGIERYHLIPEPVIPYLEQYDFDVPRSENFIFILWYQIEYIAGVTSHVHGMNWHSFRRTIRTSLKDNGVPDPDIEYFLNHKTATSSNMALRYSATKYASMFAPKGSKKASVRGSVLIPDQKIFEQDEDGEYKYHPFVGDWR